jgi:hypothetical protein
VARALDDLLDGLPQARTLPDGHGLPHLHKGKQADEHVQRLYEHLKGILRGLEENENRKVSAWLQLNPVLSELNKVTSQSLPKDAYVLLFTSSAEGKPELMLRGANENQVFTRYRPQSFTNKNTVFREFIDKPQITGAAVIAGTDLLVVLGQVPEQEGKEQLRVLRGLSNEEANKPLNDFIDANPVLKELNQLSYRRKLPHNGYVLLFAANETAPPQEIVEPAQEEVVADEEAAKEEEVREEVAEEHMEAPIGTELEAVAETTAESESPEEIPSESVEQTIEELVESEPETFVAPGPAVPLRLINKRAEDGRIITRFRAAEFSSKQELFERYRVQPKVLGAAVIRERELLRSIGSLPSPPPGQSQIDYLLKLSSQALDQPALEFLAENEVLNNLHQLANEHTNQMDNFVVLFVASESGSPTLFRMNIGYRQQTRFAIPDFRLPRTVHEQFSRLPKIIGASVIGEQQSFTKKAAGISGGPSKGMPGSDSRAKGPKGMMVLNRQVVLAAYGRTPLKAGLVATEENFKRLGIELPEERVVSIVERPAPFNREKSRTDRPKADKPREGKNKRPEKTGVKKDRKRRPRKERPRNEETQKAVDSDVTAVETPPAEETTIES